MDNEREKKSLRIRRKSDVKGKKVMAEITEKENETTILHRKKERKKKRKEETERIKPYTDRMKKKKRERVNVEIESVEFSKVDHKKTRVRLRGGYRCISLCAVI